jgi:hypothetical protein
MTDCLVAISFTTDIVLSCSFSLLFSFFSVIVFVMHNAINKAGETQTFADRRINKVFEKTLVGALQLAKEIYSNLATVHKNIR